MQGTGPRTVPATRWAWCAPTPAAVVTTLPLVSRGGAGVPTSVQGVRCVVVHENLRGHNVMAWDFCMNFAKDNELLVFHGEVPESLPLVPKGVRTTS